MNADFDVRFPHLADVAIKWVEETEIGVWILGLL
jgi:hypothetical protein